MIQTMDQSEENVLGFRIMGDVTKDDYAVLTPAVKAAIAKYGKVRVLLDMTNFKWEKVDAWSSDLDFGKELHNQIEKMALVGNSEWEKGLAKVAQPFYADQVKFFENEDSAWTWAKI